MERMTHLYIYIDDVPIKSDDFPWLCYITKGIQRVDFGATMTPAEDQLSLPPPSESSRKPLEPCRKAPGEVEVDLPGKCWKNAEENGKMLGSHMRCGGDLYNGDGLAIGIPNL